MIKVIKYPTLVKNHSIQTIYLYLKLSKNTKKEEKLRILGINLPIKSTLEIESHFYRIKMTIFNRQIRLKRNIKLKENP